MQFMKPAFRNGFHCYTVSRSLLFTLNPNPFFASSFRPISRFSSSMATTDDSSAPALSLEKQFGEFRTQLEESGTLRDRIRTVVSEIESTTRLMYASILLVHHSRPTPGTKNLPHSSSLTLISPFYFLPFFFSEHSKIESCLPHFQFSYNYISSRG